VKWYIAVTWNAIHPSRLAQRLEYQAKNWGPILSATLKLVERSLPLTNPVTVENRVTEDEWTPGDKTVTSAVKSLRLFSNSESSAWHVCWQSVEASQLQRLDWQ
jgi:hypothetical protein